MSLDGRFSARLDLARLPIVTEFAVPTRQLEVKLQPSSGKLGLRAFVAFLLQDKDFRFPEWARFLDGLGLQDARLTLRFGDRTLAASAVFGDVRITDRIFLKDARLTVELSRAKKKICICGSLVGLHKDPIDICYCFDKDWKPRDKDDKDPFEPRPNPDLRNWSPAAIAALVALMVALGYGLVAIASMLIVSGVAVVLAYKALVAAGAASAAAAAAAAAAALAAGVPPAAVVTALTAGGVGAPVVAGALMQAGVPPAATAGAFIQAGNPAVTGTTAVLEAIRSQGTAKLLAVVGALVRSSPV